MIITNLLQVLKRNVNRFWRQCTLWKNISTLSNTFSKNTNKTLGTIGIKNLNPNKSHDRNPNPLKLKNWNFKIAYVGANFHPNGRSKIFLPHLKKVTKESTRNYPLVFVPLVCDKVFKRLLYNNIFFIFFRNWPNIDETTRT